MSEWPKDWPEDAKVGPKFIQELMRRHPSVVKTITIGEAEKLLDEEHDEKPEDDITREE